MNTELLRRFVMIADQGSLTAVAETLEISPAVLSRQIRRLEEIVGAPLFERGGTGMILSDAGRAFYGPIKQVLALLEIGERAATEASSGTQTVRVGFRTLSHLARERLDGAISQLQREHPGATVTYEIFDFSDPTCGLSRGLVDMAMVYLPIEPSIEFLEFERDDYHVALSKQHPLASRASVSPEELRSECFATGPTSDPVWDAHSAGVLALIDPVRTKAVDSAHKRHQSVLNELTLALTPRSPDNYPTYTGLSYVRLEGVEPVAYGLAWRPGTLSDLAARFVDLLGPDVVVSA